MKKYKVLSQFIKTHKKGSVITDAELENNCLLKTKFLIEVGYIEEMKEIAVDEMKKGGVYKMDTRDNGPFIFRFKEKQNSFLGYYSKLKISKSYSTNSSLGFYPCDTLYIATPKEIDWLERCEKAGEYVEKDFTLDEFIKGYQDLKKENEELKKEVKELSSFTLIQPMKVASYTVKYNKKPVKKNKKGVNYYLKQLPLNVDGHTFNMNRDEDGYSICYYRCTKGDLIFRQSKSFKKALKLTYKGLKKDGHIK